MKKINIFDEMLLEVVKSSDTPSGYKQLSQRETLKLITEMAESEEAKRNSLRRRR